MFPVYLTLNYTPLKTSIASSLSTIFFFKWHYFLKIDIKFSKDNASTFWQINIKFLMYDSFKHLFSLVWLYWLNYKKKLWYFILMHFLMRDMNYAHFEISIQIYFLSFFFFPFCYSFLLLFFLSSNRWRKIFFWTFINQGYYFKDIFIFQSLTTEI